MKRIMVGSILGISLFGMAGVAVAEPYVPTGPLCSIERTYVIKDMNGNVMDETTYINYWPIDCVTRVQIKYRQIGIDLDNGKAEFQRLLGVQQNP